MSTLKRQRADGSWEYIQITGEDVTTLRKKVDTVDAQLAQKAQQTSVDAINSRSRFEQVSFPMPKIPNNLSFNTINKYYVEPLFYVDQTENMQGICFFDGYVYIGFDTGYGSGVVRKYDTGGQLIKETGMLNLGHCSDLGYRKSNGHIYVSNGGGTNPTFVYELNMADSTPTILKTLDFSQLGNSALLAVDNDHDQLIIHSAVNDGTDPTFSICNFDGTVINQFSLPYQGVPQGLEYYQNQLYFYTNNKITILNLDGVIINIVGLTKTGESEGIAIAGDYSTPYIIVGYQGPNRVYALRSTDNQSQFHSFHSLTSVSRKDTSATSLSPTLLTMAINTNYGKGDWRPAEWSNGFNWQNIVKSVTTITGTTGYIEIKLKHPLNSIGYFGCEPAPSLLSAGLTAGIDFEDPDTVKVRIYNTGSGTQVDPSTINLYNTIKILIIGAIHVDK